MIYILTGMVAAQLAAGRYDIAVVLVLSYVAGWLLGAVIKAVLE